MNDNSINYANSSGGKLLLVDDDEVTADIIKIFIGDKYQLDWVTNGLDALTKVKDNEKEYDAFLIDIGLPGQFNGIETTAELKKNNKYEDIPYIAVTAHSMHGDKERFLASGLTHYLSKPFNRKTLLATIEIALQS